MIEDYFLLQLIITITGMVIFLIYMAHCLTKEKRIIFLVNNIDFPDPTKRRNGAEVDKLRLLNLFNKMGFTIKYHENLNKEEFLSHMQTLSTSDDLRSAKCFFLAVLSHGFQ